MDHVRFHCILRSAKYYVRYQDYGPMGCDDVVCYKAANFWTNILPSFSYNV
jgi:hypothetical protein